MYNVEDLCSELLDECLERDPEFKKHLMDRIKNKMIDAVEAVDITEVMQSQLKEMVEYMVNEDSEIFDNIKETVSDWLSKKIEVTLQR